jgi:hypothetical protein
MWLELFVGAVHEELHREVTGEFRKVKKSIPIHELLQDRLRQWTQDNVPRFPLNILDVSRHRMLCRDERMCCHQICLRALLPVRTGVSENVENETASSVPFPCWESRASARISSTTLPSKSSGSKVSENRLSVSIA